MMALTSLHVVVPTPEKKWEGGKVYEKLAQIVLCDVTPFAWIYNDFSLVNRWIDTFENTDWLKLILPRFYGQTSTKWKIGKMADAMSETRQTKTAYEAALDQVCATFGIQKLHKEQQKAINMFFEGKDVFVSLPTGYGKSVIFQAIPVIASLLWKKPCTVFIVSPLKALMEDQVQYLKSLGFKAIVLSEESDNGVIEKVMNGEYLHVYGSPESFLGQEIWRDVFSCTTFKTHLVGVAIDEAHCISHWYVFFILYLFCIIKSSLRVKSQNGAINRPDHILLRIVPLSI